MKKLWFLAGASAGVGAYALLHASHRQSRRLRHELPASAARIVVLGGGFAGKAAVEALAKRLRGRAHILLIDRQNYHLFTPLLYEAATCAIVPSDIAYPLRQCTGHHGAEFLRASIRGVDFSRRRVLLDKEEVAFDYLVIALGSTTNFFGNDAARHHSLPLKQLEDGIAIRNRVVDLLERASRTTDKAQRASMLSFVIVGGGATGVETAGALADLLHRIVPKDYPELDPGDTRVILVEAGPKLLGHMSSRLAAVALRELQKMGVDVRLNTSAGAVESGHVTLSDGSTITAETIVWSAGVQASEVVARLDAPHGPKGSLEVDEYLEVRERPKVYAVGDSAHFVDSRTNQQVPLLAAAAQQEGRAVAKNIFCSISGRPQIPFHYTDLGNVLALGHRSGVALIGGVLIEGFAGWLASRLVHLARTASFRNKVVTAVDWAVAYLYDEDTARYDIEPSYRKVA